MRDVRITKRYVDGLGASADEFHWDEALPGFGVRVQPSGAKSYICKYRAGSGRRAPTRRATLGPTSKLTPDQARTLAKKLLGSVAHGQYPQKVNAAAENTLKCIAENYLDREGAGLRTVEERRATFERLVYPKLGSRQIDGIKRSEINSLLDKIEDENGPRMATLTLAYIRRVMNWHATRSDDFRSPIVRGMGRGVATKRDRVLTEDELRAFWRASQGWDHPFSHMLRFILLTATRRDEPAGMLRPEIDGDLWTIPAARYKTGIDLELPLSQTARDVLAKVPKLGKKGFVFTTNGDTPIGGFSKFKAAFDGLMLSELQKITAERGGDPAKAVLDHWTIHDLRRTARSLMTQAGIEPDHAERALGHVIGGVRGVYDRHGYRDEKRKAFDSLAAVVARILDPQPNVMGPPAA
jgi:integrase